MASLTTLMETIHQQYAAATEHQYGHRPMIQHDPNYPSRCEIGDADNAGNIQWQAVVRTPQQGLEDLAKALEVTFPPALHAYYGAVYAGNIQAKFDGNDIELLQVWNDDDFVNLQQNITGHVLMKRRLKQDDTVFIGLTDRDDLLISVKLNSGEVCLEYVGKPTHHVLAKDIESFLANVSFDH